MHLRTMQSELPWTVPYSAEYQAGQQDYSDMQHALIHIIKSAGIVCGMIDKADHGDGAPFDRQVLKDRVSDFVMCALRIANTCPTGAFDLEHAVITRMEAVNGTTFDDDVKYGNAQRAVISSVQKPNN